MISRAIRAILFVIAGSLPLTAQLSRVADTSLNLPDELLSASGYAIESAVDGLTFDRPTSLVSPPGETDRLFVVQRNGTIVLVKNLNSTPTKQSLPFLDLNDVPGLVADNFGRLTTEGECGFVGLVFHPQYASNGFFYVFYSFEQNTGTPEAPVWSRFQRVARFQVSATDPDRADPNSQVPLITQYDRSPIHNSGDLCFGSDGYLYISVGDEGGASDSSNNARFINKNFFAAILRIDVDQKPENLLPNPHFQLLPGTNPYPSAVHEGTYRIPADNPFIGATSWHNLPISPSTVRTEIYATGFRNPWRMSFDAVTGRLFAGDVGQNTREEVDLIIKGGDYGWSWREGSFRFPNAPAPVNPPAVGFNPIEPICDYGRDQGYCAVSGQVYRSSRLPELNGKYIFGDYGSGKIWALVENPGTGIWTRSYLAFCANVAEFGTDPRNGDLIFCKPGSPSGIYRLVRSYSGSLPPATLSATGAFSSLATLTPQPGLVAYDPNVPFWSDYAIKQRWFAIKNTTDTVGFNATENWTLPKGMVWVKHFDMDTRRGDPTTKRRLETRFLVKTASDVYGITYRWRADQTEADLVDENGLDETMAIEVNGQPTTQTWRYPSRGECRSCHTAIGGYALSFNTYQLNRPHLYGTQNYNQIAALSDAGYFSQPVGSTDNLPAFATASDTSKSLEWRVRSYLAVNCVSCHQPGGTGQGSWDARITTPTESANIINGVLSEVGDDPLNRYAVPGDITHSMVIKRLGGVTAPRMPPIASNQIDPAAIQLVTDWINSDIRVIEISGSLAFGDVLVGSSKTSVLTITNPGNLPLNVTGITCPEPFSGNFVGTIPAGYTQDVPIIFSPVTGAAWSDSLTVASNRSGGGSSLALSGKGIPVTRVVGISGNMTFGSVPVGSTKAAVLTIANNGNSPLTVSEITYPQGFSGNFAGTILPGSFQEVTVTFAPSAAQTYSGNVTVASNCTSGINTMPVVGSGVITRTLGLTGDMAFGTVVVGSTKTVVLTLSNTGYSPLTVSGISYPAGFSGAFSGTIPAGGSQAVNVTFTPTAAQAYSGTLTISSDKTGGGNTRSISGTGTIASTRIIGTSGNLIFGSVPVGSSKTSVLTISNSGNAPLTVTSITYPPGFSGAFAGTVPAGGSQNVTVTFNPTAIQAYTGTLLVVSNKTMGNNSRSVSGSGIGTRIISTSGNLAFGNVPVGSIKTSVLTINNTGQSDLTVTGITYPAGFVGPFAGTIPAGGSQNVTVTFRPTAVQSYTGTLLVASNKTSGNNSRGVTGSGISTRIISLSGNMAFGSVTVGTTKTATLTITNTGNSSLSVTSITYPTGFSGASAGTIPAGGSQSVPVTFSPTAVQTYGGTGTVNSDKTGGTNTRTFSGTGI